MYQTAQSETWQPSLRMASLRTAAWILNYMNGIVNRTHGITISLWKLAPIRTFILTERENASILMRG